MTTYLPSIWDYIAQAGTAGVNSFTQSRQDALAMKEREDMRKQQEAMNIFNMMFGAGQSGAMDVANVNAHPIAQKYGVRLAPAPMEMARRIAGSPMGSPEVIGQGMMGNVPVPIMKPRAWSDDQRRMAGLPTSAQQTIERGQVATAEGTIRRAPFEAVKDELTATAGRYVSEAIGGKLPTNPREFALMAQGAADRAYQMWLADQGKQGALGMGDPQTQNYARSYFADAVRAQMMQAYEAELLRARTSNYYSGGSNDPTRIARMLQGSLNGMRAMRDSLIKPFAFDLGSPAGEALLANNEQWLAVKPRIDELNQRIAQFEAAQVGAIQGIVPDNIDQMLASGPQNPVAITAPAPGSGYEQTGIPLMTPEQRNTAITRLTTLKRQMKPKALQKAFEQLWSTMRVEDRQAIARAVGGITP